MKQAGRARTSAPAARGRRAATLIGAVALSIGGMLASPARASPALAAAGTPAPAASASAEATTPSPSRSAATTRPPTTTAAGTTAAGTTVRPTATPTPTTTNATSTAAPGPVPASQVNLGRYTFGRFAVADAVVARAAASAVGFDQPQQGAAAGPWSFDVGTSGRVYVLDEVKNRVLVFSPGAPGTFQALALPYAGPVDLAVTKDESRIYVAFKPAGQNNDRLYALTAAGAVSWQAPLDSRFLFNDPLRVGPDGVLYVVSALDRSFRPLDPGRTWWPLTDAAGSPLSAARSAAGVLDRQPLAGGGSLQVVAATYQKHTLRLDDAAGTPQRTFTVTAAPSVRLSGSLVLPDATAGYVYYSLEPNTGGENDFRSETLTVRLARDGSTAYRIATNDRLFWADYITRLRVGPDGNLYQLTSDPARGISVLRYSFRSHPRVTASAATASGSVASPSRPAAAASAPVAGGAQVPPAPAAVQTSRAANSNAVVAGASAAVVAALAAVVAWVVVRSGRGRKGSAGS